MLESLWHPVNHVFSGHDRTIGGVLDGFLGKAARDRPLVKEVDDRWLIHIGY
jgi:hypothetical protein